MKATPVMYGSMSSTPTLARRIIDLAVFMVALTLALILGACSRGDATPTPPEIRYGRDTCAHCTMIISDPRFAASYAYEEQPGSYISLAFDDISDMLLAADEPAEKPPVAFFVHDYHSEEWLDAEAAFFVVSDDIVTPMGSGIAAFVEQTAAQTMADAVHGTVHTWAELRADAALYSGGHGHTPNH